MAEVEGFRDQLKEIQATMVDGKFLAEDSTAPAGQTIVSELLGRCLLWSDIVLTRCGIHSGPVGRSAADSSC